MGVGRGSISGTEHLIKLGHRRESIYNCDWLRNAWRCDLRLIVPSGRWNDPTARLQRAQVIDICLSSPYVHD